MSVILTVEDNVETQLLLKHALGGEYQVYPCYDLASARQYIKSHEVNLILLDLILPDGEGFSLFEEICTDLAITRIPIIILSSLEDVKTRVEGLKIGADDYIIKPFIREELVARVKSVLRRGPSRGADSSIGIADVTLDLTKQSAFQRTGHDLSNLNLTPIEFKLLFNLSKTQDSLISRKDLRKVIWGDTFISDRNVDTHICKLRKKLENSHIEIHNKRGKGYRLELSGEHGSVGVADFHSESSLPAFGINNHSLPKS